MSRRIPDDCTVRLIDLPAGIGGRISETPDGHVDIYINARYGHNGRRRALDHELDHYERGDLHSDLPIEAVEARADLPPLLRARDLISAPSPRPLMPSPSGGSSARKTVRWTVFSENGPAGPRNGGSASALTDEVVPAFPEAEPPAPRRMRSFHRPNVVYTLPPPTPAPPNLTPHQLRTLLAAVADLDPFICEPIF